MFGDEESVFDRLWGMIREKFGFIWDRFGFLIPLWIIRRPGSLIIIDYRPTLAMFLTVTGFVVLAISFVLIYFGIAPEFSYSLWVLVIPPRSSD